jgi:sec-independent protein translocase protein TatA
MNLFVLAGFIGGQEIIIILVIVLLLFGGKKIPELMKGLGKGMKEFKKATNEEEEESDTKSKDTKKEKLEE